ncbi:hypothetical protein TWF696_006889 [Orbilia brochopaga]|uniref:Uncharacterized protein n=1 Tax=Orbilia brochopaga TaxID=3140254 RepID=A0AAV9UTK4_9PEZI
MNLIKKMSKLSRATRRKMRSLFPSIKRFQTTSRPTTPTKKSQNCDTSSLLDPDHSRLFFWKRRYIYSLLLFKIRAASMSSDNKMGPYIPANEMPLAQFGLVYRVNVAPHLAAVNPWSFAGGAPETQSLSALRNTAWDDYEMKFVFQEASKNDAGGWSFFIVTDTPNNYIRYHVDSQNVVTADVGPGGEIAGYCFEVSSPLSDANYQSFMLTDDMELDDGLWEAEDKTIDRRSTYMVRKRETEEGDAQEERIHVELREYHRVFRIPFGNDVFFAE